MKQIAVALMLLAAGRPAFAQSAARALPPFTVSDAAGNSRSSAELAPTRRVVVFVKPGCRPCDQLIAALSRVAEPVVGPELVVIVESPADSAAAFAGRALPDSLSSATWYADASGEGWNALELNGLPVIMGVEGATIAWTHIGVPERSLLESLMRTWLGRRGGAQ